jgi:hypothetical protein
MEYLSLPKNIGEVPSEQLFKIARESIDRTHDTTLAQLEYATQPKLIAASALVEGVLVEANGSLDTIETHLGLLDIAEELYGQVAEAELLKLEAGFNHPDDQEAWLRAELQQAFIDVYRDMACGEVTLNRTKPDIIAQLTKLMNQVSSQIKSDSGRREYHREMIGLRGELIVLTKYWETYRRHGEVIALPATYRGGSGHYIKRDTHDIVFAQQSAYSADEGIWKFTTREVKHTNKRLRLDDLIRYNSPIIKVGYSGESADESIREVA